MHGERDTGKAIHVLNLSDFFFKLQIWFIYKGFPLKYIRASFAPLPVSPAWNVAKNFSAEQVRLYTQAALWTEIYLNILMYPVI